MEVVNPSKMSFFEPGNSIDPGFLGHPRGLSAQALPHDHTAAQLARRPSEASAESETQRVMREKKDVKRGKDRKVLRGNFRV